VLKPAAKEDVALLKDWRVRIISSIAPSYIAMEVEASRWSVAPTSTRWRRWCSCWRESARECDA
jgi:hypothetical protein